MKRLLIVAPTLPQLGISAGDTRFYKLCSQLTLQFNVDFWCPGKIDNIDASLQHQICKSGGSLSFGGVALRKLLFAKEYNSVLFEFWHTAHAHLPLVKSVQIKAQIIIDTVDLHFVREERGVEFGYHDRDDVGRRRVEELKSYAAADLVIFVTKEERDFLQDMILIRNSLVIGLTYEPHPRVMNTESKNLLFIGGFNHLPNTNAILWFALDIFPTILDRIPFASLTIIGSNPTQEVLDLQKERNISVHGFVKDLNPHFDSAAISIAPLRFGAGIKGKVCEALAHGIPVVSTSVGIEGLNLKHDLSVCIANTTAEYIDAICMLLANPGKAHAIGREGKQYFLESMNGSIAETEIDNLSEFMQNILSKRWSRLKQVIRFIFLTIYEFKARLKIHRI